MHAFKVRVLIEGDAHVEQDPEVIQTVEADDEYAALKVARENIRSERPELNASKIWFWSIERVRVANKSP